MDEEGCFVFSANKTQDIESRPSKRRRLIKAAKPECPCPRLFQGKEDEKLALLRYEAFQTAWSQHEAAFSTVIEGANDRSARDIAAFLNNVENSDLDGRLASGLLIGNHDDNPPQKLLGSIKGQVKPELRIASASLHSNQVSNLKIALKHLIDQVTLGDLDERQQPAASKLGEEHLLNYDLRVVPEYVQNRNTNLVLVYFEDSEGFSDSLLADLVSILHAWSDRIPFVLLFGISTSIDIFQARLSQSTTRLMQCTSFEMVNVDVEDLFRVCLEGASSSVKSLWPGAGYMQSIFRTQKRSNGQNASFVQSMKYMHMTHSFSNPLSVFMSMKIVPDTKYMDAFRELRSFQLYAEQLLEDGNPSQLRNLLSSNAAMATLIAEQLDQCQTRLSELVACLETIKIIQEICGRGQGAQLSTLYFMALNGELLDSTLVHDLLLSIRKLPSDKMVNLLRRLDQNKSNTQSSALTETLQSLDKLLVSLHDQAVPLRSEHDIKTKSLRTTIVAQKVELSKDQDALSSNDKSYSDLVKRIDSIFQAYLKEKLGNVLSLPFHEVLVYNHKPLHQDTFTPRPRYAVERALGSPHDYLACSCCSGAPQTLSPTQPATTILYQLYLESGMLINNADMWSAFHAIVGNDEAEDEEADLQRALALFSRALAELKYMGTIKQSRKRADHLAKLQWKGL